jgi:two-component system, OmpR family, phosphate regulon response regulator OmpR
VNVQPHILIVDDDLRIRILLRSFLSEHGYLVSLAADAFEAREKMRGLIFDVLILDNMMPGETGLTFLAHLRGQGNATPVIMLSALADGQNRIAGLQSGSDDYLGKPFEPQELLLRLQNLLRRSSRIDSISFGNFNFSVESADLLQNGISIHLTTREKAILRLLAQRLGQPLSRLQLAQAGSEESARSVDVQINRLRQKIEADPTNPRYLQTVRGAGYALFGDYS